MAGLSLRLPEDLETKLDEEARREGVPRSEVARTAIAEFLERKERERYIAAFVAEAQAAYADEKIRGEALELAEEAMPLDNEGLQVAETRGRYAAASRRTKKGKKKQRHK
jgi:predicted transcriptional regulator